ncbi:unnamed protein product [Parnassius apollo]|uniref:(apollo) hypothetical protein n=1 Tax=Parnassius apollo TaxID=110799 RepID=A0A8S3XQZ8_PARAO|nr:unnamed protein product [Parnassius apollo]
MDINMIDLMDLEDLDMLETTRRPDRHRQRMNTFELSDENFRYKYRFSKRFGKKIVDLLREDLVHDSRGCPLSPEIQVVCALRNWARHEIQDDTGDLHGVSQPIVSRTCKRVAEILSRMSREFIKMPTSLNEQQETIRKFRSIANFPTVIGAIDCTHIRIKKVNANGGQLYINRKGFSSINVQVVCDANLKIMDIVTRWRGSVHDSRIFREWEILGEDSLLKIIFSRHNTHL